MVELVQLHIRTCGRQLSRLQTLFDNIGINGLVFVVMAHRTAAVQQI